MPWLELETALGQQNPENLESELEKLGAVIVSFRDAGDEPILEPAPGETPQWSSTIVTALFSDGADEHSLKEALQGMIDGDQLRFSVIDDRDWQSEWQQTLKAQQFGERLWVIPEGICAPEEDAVVVHLTPGMAFGTGEHATTTMCLKWLEKQADSANFILDYGCGSGLLAIAALALGAEAATGVDIDPQALEATRNNAISNKCLNRLNVNSPEEICNTEQYDLLVANILSGTLIELGPTICDMMQPGARLALSGILADQADGVRLAWSDWADLEINDRIDDWVLVTGHKHGLLD